MKKWHILSGPDRWLQEGKDPFAAVVAAFKRKPPTSPGVLAQVWEVGTPEDGDDTAYCITTKALEAAGYKVHERRARRDGASQ